MNAGPSLFGRSMPRIEDVPLLRGAARFVDDIELPGLLHVAVLRSPVAHARLRAIDAAKARAVAGVHAVLTYADLRPLFTGDRIPLAIPTGAIRFHVDPFPLVHEEILLRRRAHRARRGGDPRYRRGRRSADRARHRAVAGSARSARRTRAGRAAGAARSSGQSGGAPPDRLRRRRGRLRQIGASLRRVFPAAQGRRP